MTLCEEKAQRRLSKRLTKTISSIQFDWVGCAVKITNVDLVIVSSVSGANTFFP